MGWRQVRDDSRHAVTLQPAEHAHRHAARGAEQRISTVNPLGRALAHYDTQLAQTLVRIGASADPIASTVSLDSEAPLLARGRSHIRATRVARNAGQPTVVMWPAFGYLEPALWRASRAQATVIMHDPLAMRRQHGYGALSRSAGRWGLAGPGVRLVCHTRAAAQAVSRQLGIKPPQLVLHPIRTASRSTPDQPRDAAADPVVLVAGQFKPSRDLALLESLGPALRRCGIRGRIIGRGWPSIAGWDYRDEFVGEEEFAAGIRAASAVVVPYRRYWQSGVAVQALEQATPVVGYRTEFLTHMHGDSHPGYVDSPAVGAWIDAVERAMSQIGQTAIQASRIAYEMKVDQSWQTLTA